MIYSRYPGFLVSWFTRGILVYSWYPALLQVTWFTPGNLVYSRYLGLWYWYPGLLQVFWFAPGFLFYSWNPGYSSKIRYFLYTLKYSLNLEIYVLSLVFSRKYIKSKKYFGYILKHFKYFVLLNMHG